MKYLITGRNGQLAREFSRLFEKKGLAYLAPGEDTLDIANPIHVKEALDSIRPDVILNCAAYNFVDGAEGDAESAMRVNAFGPRCLAEESEARKILLVHFSSDYVFDGEKQTGLYSEDDEPNPLNEYGRSKLAGERNVQGETEHHLIFRVSWLYGRGEQNFVHKLLEWSKTQDYLRIACDEFSVPTYTGTVADAVFRAIENGLRGLYHLTNGGFCSRYEWARMILASRGIQKFLRPVPMNLFKLPAKRPSFSAMSNARVSQALQIEIPWWDDAVRLFLDSEGI